MAKRIGGHRRGFQSLVMAIAVCLSGVALSHASTNSASAWSFGESPTKAFAVDGFAGTSEMGTGVAQVLEDESGNIFRISFTAGTTDVDPGAGTTLVGDGVTDAVHYVAKYSANGDFLWAHEWKPVASNELTISSAAIGPGGYLVVGGLVKATTGFDLDPTSGADAVTTTNLDPFVLRLNADGSYGWGSTFPVAGGGDAGLPAISISASGAVTLAINFEGTLSLPGSTTVTSAGRLDVAIARFDASVSTMTWLTTIGGSSSDWVATLDVASDGQVFVTGGFTSSEITVTGPVAPTTTVTRAVSAAVNSLFMSLNTSGTVQYAVPRSIGATDNFSRAAAVSSSGTVVAQLTTGEIVDVSTSGVITSRGTTGALIADIMFASTGQVVAVGNFSSTVDFDPGTTTQNRTSEGFSDGFVLKLSSDLSFISVQTIATASSDEVNSVTPSIENGYLISGRTFATSLNLSNTEYAGIYTRSATADSFGFVIRYDANGTSGLTTTTTTTTPAAPTPTPTTTIPAVAAPTRVSYVTGNKKVVLKWSAVSGASSYTVLSASGTTLCSVSTTSCSLASLKNGKMYSVGVKSKNSAGVISTNATTLKVIPGFALKVASYKVKKTPLLTAIIATPSKGAKKWRLVSGKCVIRSGRLVAPKTPGTCRLQLSVAKTKAYPAMTTTIAVVITR